MTHGPHPTPDRGAPLKARGIAEPCVTLHVGQLKTATTSLQAGLYASRDQLDRVGIRYQPAAGRHHNREAYDLVRGDDASFAFKSAAFQHTVKVALADGRAYWPDFVESARRHPGRSILSAEVLAFAGPSTVDLVAQAFADVPVRVVVTTRPFSQLVISMYGEWAKKYVLPSPDEVVRRMLLGVLDKGPASRYSWMAVERLRAVWGPLATDGWHEVAFGGRPIEDYQRDVWRAFGIESVEPPPLALENLTLPAGALLAWQEHLHGQGSYDHRVDGGTIARLLKELAAAPAAPRGRLQLRRDVADLVDACFPSAAGVEPAPAAVLDSLRARLVEPEPVTDSGEEDAIGELGDEAEHWRRAIDRSRRVVRMRIALARRLGLRRSHQPDWDRFRDQSPARMGGSPLDDE